MPLQRLLLASEDEWTARSLESLLTADGYSVLWARSGREAWRLAREARLDAVIVDAQLPELSGAEFARVLSDARHIGPCTPIIVTTSGPGARTERLAAVHAGAWLICTHPVDGELLLAHLRTFIRAKHSTDALHDAGLIDRETGLYSAQGLERRAREMVSDAVRRRAPLACVVFGPDAASASLEPATGDARVRLEYLAELCRTHGRCSDVFGRLGPGEIAVIAPATLPSGALRLAERFRAAVESSPFSVVDGQPVRIRAGYFAVSDPAAAKLAPGEIMARAASALERVREAGGDATIMEFVEFEPDHPAA